MKCPCCGGEVDEVPIDALLALPLSDMEERMLTILYSRYPRGLKIHAMIERVYEFMDEPEYAELSIRTTMLRLRKKIAEAGWTVPKGGGGRGYNVEYRLERLTQ